MAYQFDSLSSDTRTICCEFRCQRCGTTHILPVTECLPGDEGDRYLKNLKVPRGWSDHFYGWMLCTECTEKLKAFMKMEGERWQLKNG